MNKNISSARKAVTPTEHQEQQALCSWWASYCRTKSLDERLLFSVPNGILKNAAAHKKLVAEGFRPGVPDLFLAVPKIGGTVFVGRDGRTSDGDWIHQSLFHGMFIEMKRKGAPKPPPAQAAYHKLLREGSYNVVVCQGADEAIQAIKAYVAMSVLYLGKA